MVGARRSVITGSPGLGLGMGLTYPGKCTVTKPPEYQVDHGGGQDKHKGTAPVKKIIILFNSI
jgi:hypothetical protein